MFTADSASGFGIGTRTCWAEKVGATALFEICCSSSGWRDNLEHSLPALYLNTSHSSRGGTVMTWR